MFGSVEPLFAVQANSLSTLTALAANPPVFPRNSSEPLHEPLVLYLARVPGSQDVFLTPLKPRAKTVTAADVESCLYYVHVPGPGDAKLLADSQNDFVQHRKPLPPTPMSDGYANTRHDTPATKSAPVIARKPILPARNPARPPPLPPWPDSAATTLKASISSTSTNPTLPSVTLVRRDPASGAQWNVATIADPPTLDVSSESIRNPELPNARSSGAPVYLEIHNPGYDKFVGEKRPTAYEDDRRTPDTLPSLDNSITSSQTSSSTSSDEPFRRRMWMEGSHFPGRHHKADSTDSMRNEEPPRSSFDLRSSGEYSPRGSGIGATNLPQGGRLVASGMKRSATKGYTFISPWQGRCEFAESTIGTSLKCRHRLPLVNGMRSQQEPVQISELRFNLPSRPSHNKASSQSSIVSHIKRSPLRRPHARKSLSTSHISMEDIDDISGNVMGLSLGQELAGGGATGKQAKLGKLIIEDEGLKMIDLLVAANMGLWWRAYGRNVDKG